MTYNRAYFNGHSYGAGIGNTVDASIPDLVNIGYSFVTLDDGTIGAPADTTVYEDTFNRADSTTVGSGWNEGLGNWEIKGNAAALQVQQGGGSRNVLWRDTGVSDGVVEFTLGSVSGQTGQSLIFRRVDNLNYMMIQLNVGVSSLQLIKVVAGVETALTTDTVGMPAGTTYRVAYEGSSIVLSNSGALMRVTTDSTHLTGTGVGLGASSTMSLTARWDSFRWWPIDPLAGVLDDDPDYTSGVWVREGGYWKCVAPQRATTAGGALLAWNTGQADGEFQFQAVDAVTNCAIALRVQDASNFLYILMNTAFTAWELHKVVAGVDSIVNDVNGNANVFGNTTAGLTARVICSGNRIRLKVMTGTAGGVLTDWEPGVFTTATGFGIRTPTAAAFRVDAPRFSRFVNQSTSGSWAGVATGGIRPVLQNVPRLDAQTLVGLIFGINDAILGVGVRGRKTFQNGMREQIARYRAKTVYEDTDASVAYGGVWSTVAVTTRNSGAGYHSTTATGATVTITTPGGFAGGALTLGFVGLYDDKGGVANLTVNGTPTGTIDTNGLYLTPFTDYGRVCKRITGLPAGANTIVLTTTSISAGGSFDFDYWAEELADVNAPTVVVADVAKLFAYSSAWTNITDAQVDQYNLWLREVTDEFTGIRTVPMDTILAKQDINFSDDTHPSDIGAALVAAAFLAAVFTIECTVEFSPTTGPFDTPTWISLSTGGPHGNRVLSAEWTDGKQADLAEFSPGQGTITLVNDDRLFDPEHSGTYAGLLNPRVPFRITANVNGTAFDRFYGFVEDGWEQTLSPPAVATCTVKLVDLLGVISGYTMNTVLNHEVMADTPVAYWTLDETTGIVMGDRSGNGLHGHYDNVDQGQDPLVVDSVGKSIQVDHVGDNRGEYKGTRPPTAAPVTLEAWVKIERDLTQTHVILNVQRDTAYGSGLVLAVETPARGSPDGELVVNFFGLGGFYKARGSTRIDDGQVHHVAMTMATTAAADIKLYVDGNLETKTLISGTTGGTWAGHHIWVVGNVAASSVLDYGLAGYIDEVAIYETVLSAARVLAHAQAGATGLEGLMSDEQVQWILDMIGVPASMYDLDPGASRMGPLQCAGRDALEVIREITRTEQGAFYVNHADGGKLKFRQRYASFQDIRSTVDQALFSDDPTVPDTDACRVLPGSLVVEPNGVSSVINQATVTWRGGQEIVDESAGSPYGPRGISIDTQAASSDVARGLGAWIIGRNSQPAAKVKALEVNPAATPAEFPMALGVQVFDRVAYRSHPQQVGAATTKALEVLGRHEQLEGMDWRIAFYLTGHPDQGVDLFTLSVSQLSGPHILAF